jgi:hypothetical protein
MILEAIQATLSGMITAYPLLGDIESETPFAVYSADLNVLRDKTGICGYEYTVGISVVDEDLIDVMYYSTGIVASMLAITGTKMNTSFDHIHLVSETQRYDEKALCFINDIEFKINTTNI